MIGCEGELESRRDHCSKVRLRKVRESDLPVFYEHQRDARAIRMAAFPAREHDAFMGHWHKILEDESAIIRTIVYEGQVAGNVLTFLRANTREVGCWLGREYWGRGIATAALSMFLHRVRERPLYAGVAKNNIASIRVLEKCGFSILREEGDELLFILA